MDSLRHIVLRLIEMGEERNEPVLRELASAMQWSESEIARVQAARVKLGLQPRWDADCSQGDAWTGREVEQLRCELQEAKRRFSTAESLLEKREQQLREQPSTSVNSLAYLRHVVVNYIGLGDGEESDALFQVIATFLQFDEADVIRLQAERQRRAAAQAGLLGQAANFFLSHKRNSTIGM